MYGYEVCKLSKIGNTRNMGLAEVLERLRKIRNNWALHHENMPCHIMVSANEFLACKNIPVTPQPS